MCTVYPADEKTAAMRRPRIPAPMTTIGRVLEGWGMVVVVDILNAVVDWKLKYNKKNGIR